MQSCWAASRQAPARGLRQLGQAVLQGGCRDLGCLGLAAMALVATDGHIQVLLLPCSQMQRPLGHLGGMVCAEPWKPWELLPVLPVGLLIPVLPETLLICPHGSVNPPAWER